MATECIQVQSAVECMPWTRSALFINSTAVGAAHGVRVATASEWDSALASAASPSGLAAVFGCKSPLLDIQYHKSVLCARDIVGLSSGCNAEFKAIVPAPALDPATCAVYGDALLAYLSDPSLCPPSTDPAVTATRTKGSYAKLACTNGVATWAQVYPNISVTIGIDSDYGSCGYGGSSKIASYYCSSTSNSVDPCCSRLGAKNPPMSIPSKDIVKSANDAVPESTLNGQDSDRLGIAGIIGMVAGVLVLCSALFAGIMVYRNKKGKNISLSKASIIASSLRETPYAPIPNSNEPAIVGSSK